VPFPVEGDWLPTIAVPSNPFVDEFSSAADAISSPDATAWGRLADIRYATLLGLIQEYFFWPPDDRDWIVAWSFDAMPQLRRLSSALTSRNRSESSMLKAALPFTLPIVINLPSDRESRIALHRRRLARSIQTASELIVSGQDVAILNAIKVTDESAIAKLGGMPILMPQDDESAAPSSRPKANMIKLIEFLKAPPRNAANFHFGVEIDGGETLGDLFDNPEQALHHLATKNVVNDEEIEQGNKLVVAGDPDSSAFFRLIQRVGHPMKARFALLVPETRPNPAESDLTGIEITRNWIQSLE
jgi:hypothetical protein